MKTQTALYTWTAPDGMPRYLIDPAEWQDGQEWSWCPAQVSPERNPASTVRCGIVVPALGPVWVRELLPIPEPLPEVHWIDGLPIALHTALPAGTAYRQYVGQVTCGIRSGASDARSSLLQPVIVVSWPDGTKPAPPTVDGAR